LRSIQVQLYATIPIHPVASVHGMTHREAAEFIVEHARELARLARASGLNTLGYILEQAAEEAARVLKQGNGGSRRH